MYVNWLFSPPSLFPPQKRKEEEKEKEVEKPVFNYFRKSMIVNNMKSYIS